jgi:hypothetical protein
MSRKRRKSGILRTIRGVPQGKSKRAGRPESVLRKILKWVVGGVAGAALLVLLWVFGQMMFNPELGLVTTEIDTAVVEIEEDPKGFSPDISKGPAAVVVLEGQRKRILLEEEDLRDVEIGAMLRVKYTYFPRTNVIRIDEWGVRPESLPGEPSTPEPSSP